MCQNYTSCIPAEKLCDGIDDCGDNIDETTEMCKYWYKFLIHPMNVTWYEALSKSCILIMVKTVDNLCDEYTIC